MSRNVFVLIIIVFSGINLFAQQSKNPACYLNSEKIDFKKVYINPSSIESLNVKRETSEGEIYITSKSKIEFLSLSYVLDKYANIKHLEGKVLVKIDDKVIDDIADISIDGSFFIYIDKEYLSNIKYINEQFRDLVIVNISLESKDRKTQIRLRGKEEGDLLQIGKKQVEE